MGFHPHYAEVLAELFRQSNCCNVAFLGDQEVISHAGETIPLDVFLLSIRPAKITVFEHPRQESRSNRRSHWRKVDLSHSNAGDFQGYDLIIDGGTLEHVGNMASAFFAIWEGLSNGGYFVGGYPINNLCDHGYWLPQPRFFDDFFKINNAEEVNIEIVRFCSDDMESSLEILPYRQGETGQMYQPEWAKCEGQVGVFMIAKKSNSGQVLTPDDF